MGPHPHSLSAWEEKPLRLIKSTVITSRLFMPHSGARQRTDWGQSLKPQSFFLVYTEINLQMRFTRIKPGPHQHCYWQTSDDLRYATTARDLGSLCGKTGRSLALL